MKAVAGERIRDLSPYGCRVASRTGSKRDKGGVWAEEHGRRRLIWIETSMSVLFEQAVQLFQLPSFALGA